MEKQNKRQLDKHIKSLVYALTFPIVGHPMWLSTIPDDIKQQMPVIRMAQLMKEPDEFMELATDEEAMIYIMTASLVAPISHHWVRIYEYLTRKYMLTWKKKQPEELPDFLKDEINLDDYEKGLLKDLKRWIRKKQIEHVKFKEIGNKKAYSIIPSRAPDNLLTWI